MPYLFDGKRWRKLPDLSTILREYSTLLTPIHSEKKNTNSQLFFSYIHLADWFDAIYTDRKDML
jgi:hypothetical protein